MIWYQGWMGKIERVEIKSFTSKTVTLASGQRRGRDSWQIFAPTWEEVRQEMIAEANRDVEAAKRSLERAQGLLGNLKGLTAPSDQDVET